MRIVRLTTEYQENPIGLDETAPAFSWQLESARQNVKQHAYQIQVRKKRDQSEVWNTGRVAASQSANIVYQGKPLAACERYTVSLRVWDEAGCTADAEGFFETGLMNPSIEAWEGAEWIAAPRYSVMSRTRGVFRIQATFRLADGADRAGVVFGANDDRLLDESLNEYGLAGENYIRYEVHAGKQTLDFSALAMRRRTAQTLPSQAFHCPKVC